MQEWRKQMNAALGVARAEAAAGNRDAAIAAANQAMNLAGGNVKAVTAVHNIRQDLYVQTYKEPAQEAPPAPPSGPTGGAPSPSSPTTSSFSAPSSTPASPYWITAPIVETKKGIRQADPDIVLDPEIDTSGDYIVERFFEQLGGTELINISRHDLIDGINVVYNPIANLSRLRRRFNPNNIIALDILSENQFSQFSIDLLSRGIYEPYFNDDGNLVIEVDIIRPQENIEAEISESGTITRIEL
jgi:hypothetical protein